MSSWADYTVPTVMIKTGDGAERPVRGLSVDDIGLLITRHVEPMMEITNVWLKAQKDVVAKGHIGDFLIIASREFPELTSEVVAIVTDEPSLRTKRLPAGLQLKVMQAAFKLTAEDVGGMGNLSALLQQAVQSAAAVAPAGVAAKLRATLSQSSTSDSGRTRTS